MVEDRLDVLVEDRLDVLVEERLDVLIEERLVLLIGKRVAMLVEERLVTLAEGKLDALIEEGVVGGVLAVEGDTVWVEEGWKSVEETADVDMAAPEVADDMSIGNGEKVVAGVAEGFDGGPVSTLGYGIEKKMTPVEVSCAEKGLAVLVGRLGNSSCVASTELIEASAKDMTSTALEGVMVGV